MTPQEFQRRFISGLPDIPPDIDLRLDEFVTYNSDQLHESGLSANDLSWLSTIGLPRQAAPFLNFSSDNGYPEGTIPSGYTPLGSTSNGDPIALKAETGEIVRLDHEDRMTPYLINDSLPSFCACLCVIGERRTDIGADECLRQMFEIDSSISDTDSFWRTEAVAFLTR